ncbi:MAG TPA: OsmC family protein [Longimicrobiales bacterium]|nr:OsmC family protein [Longimicrobiales bacterium]
MAKRSASAVWQGGLKGGKGTMRMPRGNFEAPYSFPSRFEEGSGLSPEDLIAAAHAGCFSMAFSAALEKAGFTADNVETTANVELNTVDGSPTINKITLDCVAKVPNIDEATFQQQAADAKKNCPVSRLYKGAEITLNAKLQS